MAMTVSEALIILEDAPTNDEPCRVNPVLTQGKFTNMITGIMLKKLLQDGPDAILSDLFVLRVWQATKNQRRPRYERYGD